MAPQLHRHRQARPSAAPPIRILPDQHQCHATRGKGQVPRRDQGPRDEPAGLTGRDSGHRRVRDRCLPPAVPDRKSFRMTESDLQARPVCHRKRDAFEVHLTILFAALAVSRRPEARPAGQSASSPRLPAAIGPSRSRPGRTSSPPPTRSPTTCGRPSKQSAAPADLRTAWPNSGYMKLASIPPVKLKC
jgi:hypothetical protein